MSPICSDGEVDEFTLMPIDEALASIREKLPIWVRSAVHSDRELYLRVCAPKWSLLPHVIREQDDNQTAWCMNARQERVSHISTQEAVQSQLLTLDLSS